MHRLSWQKPPPNWQPCGWENPCGWTLDQSFFELLKRSGISLFSGNNERYKGRSHEEADVVELAGQFPQSTRTRITKELLKFERDQNALYIALGDAEDTKHEGKSVTENWIWHTLFMPSRFLFGPGYSSCVRVFVTVFYILGECLSNSVFPFFQRNRRDYGRDQSKKASVMSKFWRSSMKIRVLGSVDQRESVPLEHR